MSIRILKDGFSLMEAVVSIAIVSIGFVGIYSVFVVAEKSFAKTFEKNRLILTASSMIEDIGSDQANINDFKDMSLDQTNDLYDDLEKEKKLNKIRGKWKKRLDKAKHNGADEAPTKLKDTLIGEDQQDLLTIEMEGEQGTKVTFHRLFRKQEK